MKENDFFLNTMYNPDMNVLDFLKVGLNANNTSLEKAEVYKSKEAILNNPLFLSDGKFDEDKFDKAYNYALENYKTMVKNKTSENLFSDKTYFRDNIFVDPSKRRVGPDTILERAANGNPQRQVIGMQGTNLVEEPTMSVSELAQTQKVWDPKTETWLDAPNDAFFSNFFETRVLATWDFDADENGNKTTDPSKIVHKKGEAKFNDIGLQYYENLGDRSIYGKQVLSKFDTLTTDGSAWNKFDFFDSDDREKSIGGTIAKNIVKVAPAFIPGVAPWYLGARVALNFTDLFGKVGKMLTGSESSFLSQLEGFNKSMTMGTSEHSQLQPWTWENIINMSADVFTLLAEQRWLFKYGASLFSRDKLGYDEAAQKQFIEKATADKAKRMKDALIKEGKVLSDALRAEYQAEIEAVSNIYATNALKEKIKGINKIGEHLSKAYMTGVTVADAYGEAKYAGASDLEAALFTLGYAAGEYGILNTELGTWILPELRLEKQEIKQVINKIALSKQPKITESKEAKLSWARKVIKAGSDFFKGKYATAIEDSAGKIPMKSIASHLTANALGEGTEEVSEELLADFSKTLFNIGSNYFGTKSHMDGLEDIKLEDLTSRYALNFLGGFLGGAMGNALPEYLQARRISNITLDQAFKLLVLDVNDGYADKYIQALDEMLLGDKELSLNLNPISEETSKNPFRKAVGTDEMSLDAALKKMFKDLVYSIKSILNSTGASLSKDSLMDELTLKDLRFAALTKSSIAKAYTEEWNDLQTRIVSTALEIRDLDKGETDLEKRENKEADNERRLQLQNKLNDLLKEKDEYLDGTKAKEFIKDSIYEMDEFSRGYRIPTNFERYLQYKTDKSLKEATPAEIETYKKEWEAIKALEGNDLIRACRKIFDYHLSKFSDKFLNFVAKNFNRGNTSLLSFENTLARESESVNVAETENPELVLPMMNSMYDAGTSIDPRFGINPNFLYTLMELVKDNMPSEEYLSYIKDLNTAFSVTNGNLALENFNPLQMDQWLNTLYLAGTVSSATKPDLRGLSEDWRASVMALLGVTNVGALNIISDEKYEQNKDIVQFLNSGFLKSLEEALNADTEESKKEAVELRKRLSEAAASIGYFTNIISLSQYNALDENLKNQMVQFGKNEAVKGIDAKSVKDNVNNVLLQLEHKLLLDYSEDIASNITKLNYLNNDTKTILLSKLMLIIDTYDEYDNDKISEICKNLNDIKTTPIEELADQFLLAIGEKSIKLTDLLSKLETTTISSAARNVLSDFSLENDLLDLVDNALQLLNMLKSHVLAARTDNSNLLALYGYCATVNELDSDSNFAEITEDEANILLEDIYKLEQTIKKYSSLHLANSGLKLAIHNKVEVNLNNILYKKIKPIISALPDKYTGKSDIMAAISKYDEILSSTDMSFDTRKEQYKARLEIEKAIYDMFQKNSSDVDSLIKDIISETNFNDIFDKKNKLLDEKSQDMDAQSFIWYLAHLAGCNPVSLSAEYARILGGDKYAPIAGLEFIAKIGYSFLLNGNMFDKFVNTYNTFVTEQINKKCEESGSDLLSDGTLKDSQLNTAYHIQNPRVFLCEGIAGAGKTTGFYDTIIKLIQNSSHKDELLKNVWVVHTSESKAQSFGEDLGLENFKAFDKNSYLNAISEGHKVLKTDNVEVTEEEIEFNETTGLPKYKALKLKNVTDKPSLVIFDEHTRFSQLENGINLEFLNSIGKNALASGDFDQIGARGILDSGEFKYTFNLGGDNFVHGPKLGVSMRTDNEWHDLNLRALRAVREKGLYDDNSYDTVVLNYFEDDKAFSGDKLISPDDSQDIIKVLNLIKEHNELHPESLEQLHFIYDDPESPVFKVLESLNKSEDFKNLIDFKSADVSQGEEGDYYILDMHTTNDSDYDYYEAVFYTALTRAKKGTLVVKGSSNKLIKRFSNKAQSKDSKFKISKEAIIKYGEQRKEIIVYALPKTEIAKTEYIPLTPVKLVVQVDDKDKDEDEDKDGEELGEGEEKKDKNKIRIKPSGDDASSREEVVVFNSSRKNFGINNSKSEDFNLCLNSFNMDDFGMNIEIETQDNSETEKKDRFFVIGKNSDVRHDGLNGLINLVLNPTVAQGLKVDKDEKLVLDPQHTVLLETAMLLLMNIGRHLTSLLRIKEEVSGIIKGLDNTSDFSNPDNIDVRFKFVSKLPGLEAKGNDYDAFANDLENELVQNIVGNDSPEANRPRNKGIYMEVGYKANDGTYKYMDIPLYSTPNPYSIIRSEGFEKIYEHYKTFCRTSGIEDVEAGGNKLLDKVRIKWHEYTYSDPEFEKLPHGKLFRLFLDLYSLGYNENINANNVVYLFESKTRTDSDTVAANFKTTGPIALNASEKGENYTDPNYQNDGEWKELEELKMPGRKISNIIMDVTDKNNRGSSNRSLYPGHPFVLVSDAYTIPGEWVGESGPVKTEFLSDLQLFQAYIYQEEKSPNSKLINIFYASTPKVSVQDYFKNLSILFNKSAASTDEEVLKIDTTIGNYLTSFRILEVITKEDSEVSKKIATYADENTRNLWLKLGQVVKAINDNCKNTNEIIDVLNLKIYDIPYIYDIYKITDPKTGKVKLHILNDIKIKSVRSLLQLGLKHYIMSGVLNLIFSGNIDFDNPNVKELLDLTVKDLETKNIDGIFLRAQPDPDMENFEVTTEGGVRYIMSRVRTSDDYGYPNLKILEGFKLNLKMDHTGAVGNFNSTLEHIMNVIKNDRLRILHLKLQTKGHSNKNSHLSTPTEKNLSYFISSSMSDAHKVVLESALKELISLEPTLKNTIFGEKLDSDEDLTFDESNAALKNLADRLLQKNIQLVLSAGVDKVEIKSIIKRPANSIYYDNHDNVYIIKDANEKPIFVKSKLVMIENQSDNEITIADTNIFLNADLNFERVITSLEEVRNEIDNVTVLLVGNSENLTENFKKIINDYIKQIKEMNAEKPEGNTEGVYVSNYTLFLNMFDFNNFTTFPENLKNDTFKEGQEYQNALINYLSDELWKLSEKRGFLILKDFEIEKADSDILTVLESYLNSIEYTRLNDFFYNTDIEGKDKIKQSIKEAFIQKVLSKVKDFKSLISDKLKTTPDLEFPTNKIIIKIGTNTFKVSYLKTELLSETIQGCN